MATLKEKFTVEEMKDLNRRINHIFYQITHEKTAASVSVTELQLLWIIDRLCKVSSMLSECIEQQLEGQVDTIDPHRYIDGKLGLAESGIKNFLAVKKIDLDEKQKTY